MRGKLFFLCLMIVGLNACLMAQQWNGDSSSIGSIYRTGNVGIGTTDPPNEKLDIDGGTNKGKLKVKVSTADTYLKFYRWSGSGALYHPWQIATGQLLGGDINFQTSSTVVQDLGTESFDTTVLTMKKSGNVGIGTKDPQNKLVVSSGNSGATAHTYTDLTIEDTLNVMLTFLGTNTSNQFIRFADPEYTASGGIQYDHANNKMVFRVNSEDRVRILNNGNVGIGTTNPGTYKLAVKGTIGAQEIEVVQTIPDYVFEDDYNLRPLEEVEKFIGTEGHLPDIPSAKEFEGGRVAIGEMQERHLQKIEELTLYLIEMNKKIEYLIDKNSALENQVKKLQKN